MEDIFYSNTQEAAASVGILALFLLALGWAARWLLDKWGSPGFKRGLVSEAVLRHLALPTTVMLALVTAALVAIAFLHQVILDSEGSAFAPWAVFTHIVDNRENALRVVYFGVSGILFAVLAFVLRALSPLPAESDEPQDTEDRQEPKGRQHHIGCVEAARQKAARWAALSSGLAAVATVSLVPGMLGLLMSVFQLPQDPSGGVSPPSTPSEESQTSSPERCPYLLAGGGEACSLLMDLNSGAPVFCAELPISARPLQLVQDSNPFGYPTARYAPHLACAWTEPGTYTAGETIPSGDLRAMNDALSGPGQCYFEVTDEQGAIVTQRSDYENTDWGLYALIRLDPRHTITTGGCGWAPAAMAGLGTGPNRTIGPRQHAGLWSHPLIVGTDIEPGWVQVECEFQTWPNPTPDQAGSWAAALSPSQGQHHQPGPHRATAGALWPRC